MNESALLLIVLAFVLGFALAWVVASARTRSHYDEQLRILDRERASHETAAGELRKQIEGLRADIENTRARFEEEQTRRASAETSLRKVEENLLEQKKALEEAQAKLTDVFRALASQALAENAKQFLELATTKFESLEDRAVGDLKQKQVAIEGLVGPLKTTLTELKEHVIDLESARQGAYGELRAQVEELANTGKELRQETGNLVSSLRQPQVKGAWGQLTLRNAVELAGLSHHCDFLEQQPADTEEGILRPDLLVRLPGQGQIIIDAKVPLHAFHGAISAQNEQQRQSALAEHARLVRSHISQLASKAYWKQFPNTPEFVVMFLPGESFFSAAVEQDHTLIEDAIERRVVLASPTTLIALLLAVAYGWRQEAVAENAERISMLGKELYERVTKFTEHLAEICVGLEKANEAYNRAVGSLESRLLPSARKFRELGVTGEEQIPALRPTETPLRRLTANSNSQED